MSYKTTNNYICCSFNRGEEYIFEGKNIPVEFYYSETKDIINLYSDLIKYFNESDRIKADKFHFEEERNTWLLCHTLLRMVISAKLNIDHSEIVITRDRNNKPWLQGNQLYFNISHTRESFAFAISDQLPVGVDIEKVDREIDFRSIIKTFFSSGEIKSILEDPGKSRDRFFLLWTRKEALLKALGIGIVDKLKEVEVYRDINFLNQASFNNIIDSSLFCDHYIYSEKIHNNYLSIALPSKSKIEFHMIDIPIIKTLIENFES